MTRKRFVKLLMSEGYSRNEAAKEAAAMNFLGYTYDEWYLYCRLKTHLQDGTPDNLLAAADRVMEAIKDGIQYMVEMIPTIIETITAAIPQVIASMKRIQEEAENITE